MNVLIVDDDIQLGRSLARVLTRLGHDVKTASSIEQALRLLATEHPGVLLTDISLGDDCDGVDLACWAAYAYGTPIVVMTGGDRGAALSRLQRAGLRGISVLPKPVSLETLVDELAWTTHETIAPAAAQRRN